GNPEMEKQPGQFIGKLGRDLGISPEVILEPEPIAWDVESVDITNSDTLDGRRLHSVPIDCPKPAGLIPEGFPPVVRRESADRETVRSRLPDDLPIRARIPRSDWACRRRRRDMLAPLQVPRSHQEGLPIGIEALLAVPDGL